MTWCIHTPRTLVGPNISDYPLLTNQCAVAIAKVWSYLVSCTSGKSILARGSLSQLVWEDMYLSRETTLLAYVWWRAMLQAKKSGRHLVGV